LKVAQGYLQPEDRMMETSLLVEEAIEEMIEEARR